jgi:hypothetical protein
MRQKWLRIHRVFRQGDDVAWHAGRLSTWREPPAAARRIMRAELKKKCDAAHTVHLVLPIIL